MRRDFIIDIEKAKSNRSKCNYCGKQIQKGELRGRAWDGHFGTYYFYCKECTIKILNENIKQELQFLQNLNGDLDEIMYRIADMLLIANFFDKSHIEEMLDTTLTDDEYIDIINKWNKHGCWDEISDIVREWVNGEVVIVEG